jgi:nucleoside-diphosphate-sugar epimerase
MSEAGRRVVVTGAGGFIGCHLVRDQLARGRTVVATDIDLSRLEALQLDGELVSQRADLRDTDAMRRLLSGADTLFHLAAAHLDVLKDEAYFYDVNVRATSELVRLAGEAGVRRVVHCSTVGLYGPLESLPADEDTVPRPDIPYERSKLAGELAVRETADANGVSTVILRPAWVYGPLCPRTLKLIRTIARKRFFFVGDGANRRHPIHITDMVDAFERAAEADLPSGATLIAAGPDTVTVRELVELIIEELGMAYRPPRLPTWFMEAACLAIEKAAALAGREPPFSRRSLKFFSDSSAYDITRARRQLGFDPAISTHEGMRLTIQYYREQGIL